MLEILSNAEVGLHLRCLYIFQPSVFWMQCTGLKVALVSFYGFMNSDLMRTLPSAPFQCFVGQQCQHQNSPGVSQVNCGARTAWRGEKKHHSKVRQEGKTKLGLPPYAPKHNSLPVVGWSIFAVWDRCDLWEKSSKPGMAKALVGLLPLSCLRRSPNPVALGSFAGARKHWPHKTPSALCDSCCCLSSP